MTILCGVVIISNSVLWSLNEGCVPRVCIGYMTNGFSDICYSRWQWYFQGSVCILKKWNSF